MLPLHYQTFQEVFCKKCCWLPPHHLYDCAIYLQPGMSMPRGQVHPLSIPETQACLRTYGKICRKILSLSPILLLGPAFYLWEKKMACIDCKGFNTITNLYPLPLVSDLFDRPRNAQIFPKLDLRGAYNLIRIREGDEWTTIFNTRDGKYEYPLMPSGLCSAPAVFQNFIHSIFSALLYCMFVSLCIWTTYSFSPDLNTHCQHVCTVLWCLQDHRLYATLEKCLYKWTQVLFLCYIVTDKRLSMDPAKL